MQNEIRIKLTIDNKETTASLALTDEQVRRIYSSVETLSSSPLLKQFAQDLLGIGTVSDEAAQGIQDFIKYNQLSEKQIQSVIRALEQEKQTLAVGSAEYAKSVAAIQNVTNAYTRMNPNIASGTTALMSQGKGLSGFNMMIGQTGFLLSDMDMFFVNFRMGLLSVGNNISMVASTIGVAMNQAAMQGMSFGAALKQSLSGFNLWLLGINAGMFIIQMLTRLFSSQTEEVKKQRDEVANLRKEYSQLSTEQAVYERSKLIQQLGMKGAYFDSKGALDTSKVAKDNKEEVERLIKSLQALNTEAAATAEKINNILLGNWNFKSIASINEAVALLRKEYDNAESDASRQFLKRYIDVLEKKAKELGLDSKTPKEEKFITTTAQIEKEITQLKQKAAATKDLAEQILYLQEIEKREAELKFRQGIGRTAVNAEAFMGDPIKFRGGDHAKGGSLIKLIDDDEIKNSKERVDQFNSGLIDETVRADQAWRRLGQAMSQSLSNAIMRGEKLEDVLSNMLGMFLEMGLQATFMGLISMLLPGGSFLKGFGAMFGLANGGIINEPIVGMGLSSGKSYAFGEGGIPEMVMPMNRIYNSNAAAPQRLQIELIGEVGVGQRGTDLYGTMNKRNIILKKYY